MNESTILDCGHAPSPHESFTTGYGVDAAGRKSCYACCAKHEREQMDATGRATLYLVGDSGRYEVTDWPGELRYKVTGYRRSWHNMAGRDGRIDVWFRDHAGKQWHGYQIGQYTQICHCRRVKG